MKEDQDTEDVKKAVNSVKKLAELCKAKTPIKTTSSGKTIGQYSIQGGMLDYTETKTTEGELIITDSQDFSYQTFITYEHVYEDKLTFSTETGPERNGDDIIIITDAAVSYEDKDSLSIMVTEEVSKEIETILYYLNDKTNVKTESIEEGCFTYKTEKPTGKWKSFDNDTIHIKLEGKEVGTIDNEKPHQIHLMIMKDENNTDSNPNCDWKWIKFAAKFNSVEEAKNWLYINFNSIVKKYKIRLSDN